MAGRDHESVSSNNNVGGDYKNTARCRVRQQKQVVEQRLYHIFQKYQNGKDIAVAEILKLLSVVDLHNVHYRSIKFSLDALFRACVLKEVKGLRCYTQLEKYLGYHKKEAQSLGFDEIPNRRTFSHFITTVAGEQTRELIGFTARKMVEIADKFSIDLDIDIKVEKAKKPVSQATFYRTKKTKAKELARLLRKKISPFMDLNMADNCTYTKNHFLNLLTHLCLTQDFAENGSKTLREARDMVPDADTLLYHLKHYDDMESLKKMFLVVFEKLWDIGRSSNLFNPRRKYDVAVDFTEWFFYGDKGAPMVMGKKPERGTDRCYKFATINIVEADRRFTLLALPVGPFDKKEDILTELLHYARQRITIRRVYLDRGFFSGNCIKAMKRLNLKFLMPCTSNNRIKQLLEQVPAPFVVRDYEMGDVTFNLVIVKDEKRYGNKKLAFASNEDWNENDLTLSERLCRQYNKRWGVETSYRVKKHSFRPKTTSKNYFVRLFYFLLSVLLYNLWILLDILLCLLLFGSKAEDHIITSKLFGTIFYTIKDG